MLTWYAVHTHVHGEDTASWHLRRQGFGVYLPKQAKTRRHARRTERIEAPLFPRYLFVSLDAARARWRAIHSTFGVSHLVCFGSEPAPVPEEVIEDLRACENEVGLVDLGRRIRFRKGDRVRLLDGPFSDSIALFDGVSDERRVIVLLELLGRQVRVKVPQETVTACVF